MSRPEVEHPYIGRLVRFWLLDQPEVTDVFGDRVVSDLATDTNGEPVAPEGSWVQVHDLGGAISDPGWISTTLLQVDVVAGARYATHQAAEMVRRVLDARFRGVIAGDVDTAAITGLTLSTPRDDTDDRFPGKPVPRTTFTVQIHSHPTSLTGS